VQVVAFDPGTHAIATYHGRFDENGDISADVKNLAVYVPGTKTRIDYFNSADTRAYDLYDAANFEHREAGQTAVIAWAGGQFPQFLDAAEARHSQELAPRPRDFVAAVDTHPEASTLTVTRHSYGGRCVVMRATNTDSTRSHGPGTARPGTSPHQNEMSDLTV
jgi:hypothetical protein